MSDQFIAVKSEQTHAELRQQEFMADTRLEARDALRAVVAAYDACKDDEANRIGTPLMCALEAARRVL